ncbi:MAG TPA: L-aspartate oxidase [Burkholderiales bacterium]|nr:L-aspartate oxidase [Burkholderiales bacterium]
MNAFSEQRVIVVGAGIAGLATALRLAPLPVTLLVKAPLGTEASTPWAHGGIAAAMGNEDAPEFHAADTIKAGAFHCDEEIVASVTAEAPACIEDLIRHGVKFDRDAQDALSLGLEAAHSQRRIVHAGGDATGLQVVNALIKAAKASPSIEILDDVIVTELVLEEEGVRGVKGLRAGTPFYMPARAVVLATGGAGGLYANTTNPIGSIGSGFVLAARAGAVLRDVEFVQFHPTAMAVGRDPMPLATEALRGEGAVLVNSRGDRFMADVPGQELAPRDVVARAIWAEIERGQDVYLDARAKVGARFPHRFPAVYALCQNAGIDPLKQPIPVRPAAHYHMGGIAVDQNGRTSVPGLWACGEVAATGLHGANRLASNSLLEGAAFARWIAVDIAATEVPRTARLQSVDSDFIPRVAGGAEVQHLRDLMTRNVGVTRDEASLTEAIHELSDVAFGRSAVADRALAGLFIAVAANMRTESRGAHFRRDHVELRDEWAHRIELTLADLHKEVQRLQSGRVAARA